MKSINDWKRKQILEALNLEGYDEPKGGSLSFNEWRLRKVVDAILEEQTPQQNPLGQPDPNAIPGQPPNPQFNVPPMGAEGQPQPGPEAGPPQMGPEQMGQEMPPPGPEQQQPPESPPQSPTDDKAFLASLQPVLGDKPKDILPSSSALKLEAEKEKKKIASSKGDSVQGLKNWLWICIDAWNKAKVSLPKPKQEQPQQGPPQQGPPQQGPPQQGPPQQGPPQGPPPQPGPPM
jgi:hypothetical protein